MKTVTVEILNGDYVLAGEEGIEMLAGSPGEEYEDGEVSELTVTVPDAIADALAKHGTSEQVFSDGYEAYDAIRQFIKTEVPK